MLANEVTMGPEAVIASGLKRLMQIATKHGITSKETLAGVERWGMILDDVTHPPQYCTNCGDDIYWDFKSDTWYHEKRHSVACLNHAGSFAQPVS
jgi:hypothetical protein